MKFYFDNMMSWRFAEALQAVSTKSNDQIVHAKDKFPEIFQGSTDVPDQEWMSVLIKEGGWAIISGDDKIRSRPAEQGLFLERGFVSFFPASGWEKGTNFFRQFQILVRWWPEICAETRIALDDPNRRAVWEIPLWPSGRSSLHANP